MKKDKSYSPTKRELLKILDFHCLGGRLFTEEETDLVDQIDRREKAVIRKDKELQSLRRTQRAVQRKRQMREESLKRRQVELKRRLALKGPSVSLANEVASLMSDYDRWTNE